MYPLLCAGRYPVPEKEGVLEIVAVAASPLTVATAIDIQLRDDWGANSPDFVLDPDKNKIIHLEGDGNSPVFVSFDPPLKTRKGLIATTLTNAVCHVYVR